MKYYIGLDIGTGSTKALAIEALTGTVLSTSQLSYPTLHPSPYHSEQDPEQHWIAFIGCLTTLIERHGKPQGIGISCAMHSLIPMSASNEPLAHAILWSDARSTDQADQLRHHPLAPQLYESTGTPIHAMSPLAKIIWIREKDPMLFGRTSKFISIKEYIWYRLFNCYEVDYSLASATGLFDLTDLSWSALAINLAGINTEQLSTPVATTHFRITAAVPGILDDIPIVIGGSDGCLANLGSGVVDPGSAALTIGTSGAFRVSGSAPISDYQSMIFNYHLDTNTFVSGGAINNGGVAWQWFVRDFLQLKDLSPEEIEILIDNMSDTPAADGLLFLPYLLGERAPIWNSRACGVFFGITAQHTRGHFVRAVLEGITFSLFHVYSVLESKTEPIKTIYASGGFTQSTTWLQLVADIFGKEVVVRQADDASAVGAVMIAIKAIEQLDGYPAWKKDDGERVVYPRTDFHEVYQGHFKQYKRLYELLRAEMEVSFNQRLQTKPS